MRSVCNLPEKKKVLECAIYTRRALRLCRLCTSLTITPPSVPAREGIWGKNRSSYDIVLLSSTAFRTSRCVCVCVCVCVCLLGAGVLDKNRSSIRPACNSLSQLGDCGGVTVSGLRYPPPLPTSFPLRHVRLCVHVF